MTIRYIIEGGDIFDGTLEEFSAVVGRETTHEVIIEFCKSFDYDLDMINEPPVVEKVNNVYYVSSFRR